MAHHPILPEIEAFLKKHGMAESTFGRKAVKDWKFISELRGDGRPRPRRLWPETEQAVRDFMRTYPEAAPEQAAA